MGAHEVAAIGAPGRAGYCNGARIGPAGREPDSLRGEYDLCSRRNMKTFGYSRLTKVKAVMFVHRPILLFNNKEVFEIQEIEILLKISQSNQA